MPISKDNGGTGTGPQGEAAPDYCRNCFEGGNFTQPALTMDDAMDRMEEKMQADKALPFAQRQAVAAVSRLKRWSEDR
jgi:hypothetical protein